MEAYIQETQKYLTYIKREEFEYDIHISLGHRYVYVETPKAGCSTIKDTLHRIELDYPEMARDDFEDIHRRDASPLLHPSQTYGFDRIINNTDYFVFCFVRNPFERLLSAYLDKIIKGMPGKRSILIAMGKDPGNLKEEISFEQFVDVVCDLDVSDMDPHWRIQYHQTFQDTINYDFVGRMENFSNDCKTAFGRITPDYMRYLRSEKRHATNSSERIGNYYNRKILNKVYDKYKLDFECFGYSKHLSV